MSFPIQLTDGTTVKVTHKSNGVLVGEDGTLYRPTTSTLRFERVPVTPPVPVEEFAPAQVEEEPVENDGPEATATTVEDAAEAAAEAENDALVNAAIAAGEEMDRLNEDELLQAEAEEGQIGA